MIEISSTKWSDLERWDFKYARIVAYRLANPTFRELGEFVEEASVPVDPRQEPETEWPVYGVNNRDGVFLNEYRYGSEFNANQKRIERDWFFHNPTRANVGSIGRVQEVEPNAITSPEYQVWRLRTNAPFTADFIEILIRTPMFLEQVQMHRVGAVKERLYVENLQEILVPMISPEDQKAIVAKVGKARKKVAQARADLETEQATVGAEIGALVNSSNLKR